MNYKGCCGTCKYWISSNRLCDLADIFMRYSADDSCMDYKTKKMKPIIFRTDMVQAIQEGRKTMTRRVVTPQPKLDSDNFWQWLDCQWGNGGLGMPQSGIDDYSKYKSGDILWVRETWLCVFKYEEDLRCYIKYKSDDAERWVKFSDRERFDKCVSRMDEWRPSNFLLREAARIFLKVKNVRVERVNNISVEDMKKEGTREHYHFSTLWDTINAKRGYGWDVNPWVWVYEFEQVKEP